ncbi:MAG TPA: hypothetical protein VIJ06_01650 [Methylovirgula sp.]
MMKTAQAVMAIAAFSLVAATAAQAAEGDMSAHKDTMMNHKMKNHHPAVVIHRKHHPHPNMKHHHHPMHPMHPMTPVAPAH